MTSEYTPRMIELLVAYRMSEAGLMMDPNSKPHDPEAMAEADAEFYRALAAHDAEVAEKTLEEAAECFGENQSIREGDVKEWLRMRAAGIREGKQ